MALLNPQQAHTWLYIVVGCNLASIVGKVWLGIITNIPDPKTVADAINNAAQCGPAAHPETAASLIIPKS